MFRETRRSVKPNYIGFEALPSHIMVPQYIGVWRLIVSEEITGSNPAGTASRSNVEGDGSMEDIKLTPIVTSNLLCSENICYVRLVV